MDCPECFASMSPELNEDGSGTLAWVCAQHGKFPIVCVCGVLEGQEHDILCNGPAEGPLAHQGDHNAPA